MIFYIRDILLINMHVSLSVKIGYLSRYETVTNIKLMTTNDNSHLDHLGRRQNYHKLNMRLVVLKIKEITKITESGKICLFIIDIVQINKCVRY